MRSASFEPSGRSVSDVAACRKQLRQGSRTFLAASRLLPRQVRDAACVLYAFCRLADDAVDAQAGGMRAVDWMRERLDRVYLGRPADFCADRALTLVVERYGIPRALPNALLEGFEWDAQGRQYDNLAQLQDYAARVAGSVGAMMALIMEIRDPSHISRACELGIAMQLSNIARDVGEDGRAGRLYLPRDWMIEEGIEPDGWMASPRFDERLGRVVERLLGQADLHYAMGQSGIGALPWRCRPAIQLASVLYAEIGHAVARAGYDSVSGRAIVSAGRKAMLCATRLLDTPLVRLSAPAAVLEANRFLIDSIPCTSEVRLPSPWHRLDLQVQGVIDLFERLELRDRIARQPERYPDVLRGSSGR